MIDPRALQQHFNKVRQKEQPQRQTVPRVPDPVPLTAFQAIPISIENVVQKEKEEAVTTPVINKETKIEPKKEIVNLLINVPALADKIIINDFEEEVIETKNKNITTQTQNLESTRTIEDYDPYGYYSGPKF